MVKVLNNSQFKFPPRNVYLYYDSAPRGDAKTAGIKRYTHTPSSIQTISSGYKGLADMRFEGLRLEGLKV